MMEKHENNMLKKNIRTQNSEIKQIYKRISCQLTKKRKKIKHAESI